MITRFQTLLASLLVAATAAAPTLALDGVVALQSADASCGDDSGAVYVDCGNGTVTDTRTGLVWLRNPSCFGAELEWSDAMALVAGLAHQGDLGVACGLSDHSRPGEWRLPTIAEWAAMVADARALGCSPSITDDLGTGCWADCTGGPDDGCSFQGVEAIAYWTATTAAAPSPNDAWYIDLEVPGDFLEPDSKYFSYPFWPVRGGQ